MLFHLKATPYDIYQPGLSDLKFDNSTGAIPSSLCGRCIPISHSTDWSWRRGLLGELPQSWVIHLKHFSVFRSNLMNIS